MKNGVLATMALVVIIIVFAVPGNLRRQELETRRAQAEAEKAQALAIMAQAQADAERAAGERAVLEAAARAVEIDTDLTEYYARRGDSRVILAALLVIVALLAFAGYKREPQAPPVIEENEL